MKMTMHIDEVLLDRVVEKFGFPSKTQAVDTALREMERRARFRGIVAAGLGLTAKEIRDAVAPDYDVLKLRVAEKEAKYAVRAKPKRPRR
jgi:Arc/MetJ family transcription regulator